MSSSNPLAWVEAQRRQAAQRSAYAAVAQEHSQLKAQAQFEASLESKAALADRARREAADAEQEAQARAQAAEAAAEARRREEAEREAAAAAQVMTTEQRRAALAEQARELKAAREAERQRVVDEKLAQQFAACCDPLRTAQSRAIGAANSGAWQAQLAEKEAAKAAARRAEEDAAQRFEAIHGCRIEARHQQVGAGGAGAAGGEDGGSQHSKLSSPSLDVNACVSCPPSCPHQPPCRTPSTRRPRARASHACWTSSWSSGRRLRPRRQRRWRRCVAVARGRLGWALAPCTSSKPPVLD